MANGSYDVILLDTTKELILMLGIRSYSKINRKQIRGLVPQIGATDPTIDKNANIKAREMGARLHVSSFQISLR